MLEGIKTETKRKFFSRNVEYYYVIYGAIPEAGQHISYRRIGRRVQQYKRKLVKCPYCSERLTDADADTKIELYHQPALMSGPCQLYLVCTNCKHEIGISIIYSTI